MGTVLVDSSGKALYTSDQEASGTVKCVNDCTNIWQPLTVSDGQTPTGKGVSGTLGTVKRPDGSTQVTLNGKPLYRFALDKSAGQVNGQGAKDSFGGTSFSWQVATSSGAAAPTPTDTGLGGGYTY